MAYKYLLMDNDGTLMDFVTAQAKALELTWNSMPQSAILPFSPYLLEVYDRCNKNWWAKLERGECTKAELQPGRFADFLEELGMIGDADEMTRIYGSELSKRQDMLPFAVETMKELSEKYEIFIITNGVTTTQHSRIDSCSFAPYFKKMYVSEETGFAKPDVKYFQYVMDDIGDNDTSHYLVIGDSLASDIKGAMNAGMDAVWINAEGTVNHENLPVKYEIKSVHQLIDILN